MKTVLLTAAGSASAEPLLARYRALGYRVVCSDIYPREWNAACVQADAFYQVPPVKDGAAYLAALEDIVRSEKADFLIPLTDVEVDLLCGEKPRFAALNCLVCTPAEPCVRLCRSKPDSAARLKEKGICRTIPTVSPYGADPEKLDYPVILKPAGGRSSQGKVIAKNPAEFSAALPARDDYILQPFLEGPIFTADVARDAFGNVLVLVRKELLRTGNGLGTTVRVFSDHPLNGICAAIAEEIGLLGVVNMEFIEHGGEYFFLEINPRFSGGTGFSIAAGLDLAQAELACHRGEALPPRPALREMTLARSVLPVITD